MPYVYGNKIKIKINAETSSTWLISASEIIKEGSLMTIIAQECINIFCTDILNQTIKNLECLSSDLSTKLALHKNSTLYASLQSEILYRKYIMIYGVKFLTISFNVAYKN